MMPTNEEDIVILEISVESLKDTKTTCAKYKTKAQGHNIILNTPKEFFLDDYKDALNTIYSNLSEDNYSLVIVALPEQYNEIPSLWDVVPTIQEAHDFIGFEQIQRDLEF